MGFWSPLCNLGFHYSIPEHQRNNKATPIFYFEAYAVVSALHWAVHLQTPPARIAIFTDNYNTVNIFDSLRASPKYNPFLLTAVDLIIQFNIQL
ncbi:hypothetical protein BDZ94DRAFT_1339844 [Collybia nuda]|uniref:Uncharacterized protein n=1 Tax=Collybia nuda TaxID=64659 RepID=A0A9P5XXS3_9AGAR|nr:hypothetical protein BDZ94DRAFT_1339844 [Collybia nuda]